MSTYIPFAQSQAKGAADKAAGGGKDAALQGPANKLLQQVPPPLQLPCRLSGHTRAAPTPVQADNAGGSRSQSAGSHQFQ